MTWNTSENFSVNTLSYALLKAEPRPNTVLYRKRQAVLPDIRIRTLRFVFSWNKIDRFMRKIL